MLSQNMEKVIKRKRMCLLTVVVCCVRTVPPSLPANCLSPLPRLPNLVTSLPFSWKMKTQQDLLSTTMTWPFLSTETPLGPISFPEPILFCRRAAITSQEMMSRVTETRTHTNTYNINRFMRHVKGAVADQPTWTK